jgi:hypothetical protein
MVLSHFFLRTVRLLNVAMKLSEPLIVAYGDVYSGINATAIYRAALTRVRWYVAYPLSTRHVEELME